MSTEKIRTIIANVGITLPDDPSPRIMSKELANDLHQRIASVLKELRLDMFEVTHLDLRLKADAVDDSLATGLEICCKCKSFPNDCDCRLNF